MLRTRVASLLPLGAVMTGLCACGHAQEVGRARIVQVTLSEYRLSPPKLRVRQGPLTLVIHDFGRLAHNLGVLRGQARLAITAPIQPGNSLTLAVYLTPGTYTLASTLFDDQSLGVRGKLTVTP